MAYFNFAKNTISCYRERLYGFGPSWKFNTEETLHKNTAIHWEFPAPKAVCYLQDIPRKIVYSFQHHYKRVILVDLRYPVSEAHNIDRLLKMKEDRPINWFLNSTYKERLIALALLCLKRN